MRSPRSRCKVVSAFLGWFVLSSCGVSALKKPLLEEHTPTTSGKVLGPRFRVLSWNVHKETGTKFVADLDRLLDSGKVDLVLLQEAAVGKDPSPFLRSLEDRFWAISANLSQSSSHTLYGALVASRVRPIGSRAMLSKETEPVAGTAKAALFVRFPTGTDTLTVVNLHALNFSPRHDGFCQQLTDIQKKLGPEPGPCVVAGDFNTWSSRKRSLADSILSRSGLVPVDFGARGSKRTTGFGHPLDHVYYTPRFLRVHPGSSHVHDSIRSSDHVPLEVEFESLSNPVKPEHSDGQPIRESIPTDRIR